MIKCTLINLHPNEYTQELRYNTFAVNLDRFVKICNTLNDLSRKMCVASETEDLNLIVFNMVIRIN